MSENTENQKKGVLGYQITIGIMAVIIIVLLFLLNNAKTEVQTVVIEKQQIESSLQGELDSLMVEHDRIKAEYGDLTTQMTEKDSLILAQVSEIKTLIAKSADYKKIKRKLDYLRGIQQSYVDQIDSLFTVNQQLKNELAVAQTDIQVERTKTSTLSKEKEELNQKVTAGSKIKAYNVEGMGINLKGKTGKEVETFKANRVDRVKICFTVGQNSIATAGKRTIYIRLSRPDKVVVTPGKGDEYAFEANGNKLQYTLKKEFDYDNKSINMCVNWDKVTEEAAMKGVYFISVYLDGEEIGQSSFELQ